MGRWPVYGRGLAVAASALALLAGQAVAQTPLPRDADGKVIWPKPPEGRLKLVRVGGALDGRVTQFFDESSVMLEGGKAQVWRLYVLGSPRPVGRMMTQAIWALSEFDCDKQVVNDRMTTLLGMSLEPTAHGRPDIGASLYNGALADAETGREACGGEAPEGPRYASVSEAIRKARATPRE